MKTLADFALKEEYKRLESVGDKLAGIDSLIDWKTFRIILDSMYINKTVSGGRPETDVIMMFKMLVLQQWHELSYFELEKQCIDRISFTKFLEFPEYIPDSTTV
jgi:transposase, IS5 family